MKRREVVNYLTGMAITVLLVVFALGSGGILRPLAQISPLPTSTFTPLPPGPTPTSTSVPHTPTNTPIPPTPTSTPIPPTPTDTKSPISRVRHLKRVHYTRFFKVRWRGRDRGGSGIECYDVQYKDGSDVWQDWKICTTSTSAEFHGEWEHRYFFRVRAIDNAGNVEAWPLRPDARTRVRRKE
ncbi:MAG: fibronectin type III domain-containing protein [Chloroflexi bacterium]|nr:fibronectin type III domain-containing protein [Chloroflexota bacterium]